MEATGDAWVSRSAYNLADERFAAAPWSGAPWILGALLCHRRAVESDRSSRKLPSPPAGWRWVSGNPAFIAASTRGSTALNPALLVGVIAWEMLAALLF
jgi:hypothetical protein